MAEKKFEVTILDRREITTYPELRRPVTNVAVTYVHGELAPRTIYIPKEKYTKELVAKMIRADVEKLLKVKPERITV